MWYPWIIPAHQLVYQTSNASSQDYQTFQMLSNLESIRRGLIGLNGLSNAEISIRASSWPPYTGVLAELVESMWINLLMHVSFPSNTSDVATESADGRSPCLHSIVVALSQIITSGEASLSIMLSTHDAVGYRMKEYFGLVFEFIALHIAAETRTFSCPRQSSTPFSLV